MSEEILRKKRIGEQHWKVDLAKLAVNLLSGGEWGGRELRLGGRSLDESEIISLV